ncbi:MAG TPA: DAK2 domain-containing protein [Anaerolineales bacterium]|nr:DAK2 domain-containing protein [Anaerolineales bacterium]HNN13345.1 DAK2 domain-containing protein [Anaerolineales bacterium]HNO31245.1 DAK2 domain-containing protein [Anaerolineales bacterium]
MAINTTRVEKFRKRPIDGLAFKHLVEAGLTWLRTNQQVVNALNVFPVPDGDTGTNMTLTLQSAWNEVKDSGTRHLGEMAAAFSKGALMGARGNSGVITSQILRGFSRGVHESATLDVDAFIKALGEARDTAYKGVVKPVEGTILTVIKETANAAEAARGSVKDAIELLEVAVKAADEAVKKTPELLPILKQAGVVDSGGKGLFFFLEGMLRHVYGESLETPTVSVQPLSAMGLEDALGDVEEGQDYEVVVDFVPTGELDLHAFYGKLEEMGTSIQVGEGDGMYRMHIHVPTENRYVPIDYIMGIGTVTKVAIENLMAQMDDIQKSKSSQIQFTAVEPGNIAVVVVSPGTGLSRIFASLGVAAVVAGGQTMNPSTQDILSSFENMPTDKVIILPNNKNIVMAANQAREVTVKSVQVVPTRTVPQGLAAMLSFDPGGDVAAVAEKMIRAMGNVKTGEITVATRSVEIDGVTVRDGQVIALLDGKLVASSETVEQGALDLLDKADAASHEIVTLFFGEGMPHAEANRIADVIRAKYSNLEVEVQEGGQPHYQFILSIE